MEKDFLLIIDGSSLLSTQFYGNLPREIMFAKTMEDKEKFFHKIMQTKSGIYTNGVYGFLRTLFSIIEKQKPKYIAVTWDVTRDTFRRGLYSEYKANRSETMAPLKEQFILCQDICKRINIPTFMDSYYEADDYSGTLASKFGKNIDVRILTKDHDYLQLVENNTKLWLIVNDQTKADEFYKKNNIDKSSLNIPEKVIELDREGVNSEYGVYPESIPSLKGLMGDASDNISGVKGVGEKTAVKLIAYYKTVDALYDDIEAVDKDMLNAKWKEKLGITRSPYSYLIKESDEEISGKKAAMLSTRLATIIKDVPVNVSLNELELNIDVRECLKVLKELEINTLNVPSMLKDNSTDEFSKCYKSNYVLINDFMTLDEYRDEIILSCKGKRVAIDTGMESECLESLGICTDEKLFHIVSEGFILSGMLEELLKDVINVSECIIGYNIKRLFKYLRGRKFEDVSLMYYLINPLAKEQSSREICNLFGVYPANEINVAFNAYVAHAFIDKLCEKLISLGMKELYDNIEKPLIEVLYEMECNGIKCSAEELMHQGQVLKNCLATLEQNIYDKAGHKFNILSPKQLGVVLFEELKLPGGKKTKSGSYKTDIDVLSKLTEYDIVDDILSYRQLSKLVSTYIEGLEKCIRTDGRIHPTFNQMITATGRLSCEEPNLQNIPVREEQGRLIRKAFIPEKGNVFVDADYSQIELRILAHMAEDKKLLEDYNNSKDIHQATAASVFGVPYELVTKKQRSNAKAVNFGIVYGISSYGLGNDLDIAVSEAKKYIETYFKQYPDVKKFIDGLVNFCKEHEYVKTLFGRVRPVPEITSSNYSQRSFGERIAMNTPIQGTAADIMKIAMIKVYNALKSNNLKAKMLLQIHDEILVECPKEEAESVSKILMEEMSSAAKLKVALEVTSGIADNWYELK